MASTNIVNSTNLALYIGALAADKIAFSTDAQFSVTMDPRDITNKDSGGWRELLEGLRSWNMSTSYLYLPSASWGFTDFFSAIVARVPLEAFFQPTESGGDGDEYYTGDVYVTNGNLSSPNTEDNVVVDSSFEGTGPVTEGTAPVV